MKIRQVPMTRQQLCGMRERVRQEENPGPGRRMKWLQRHPKLAPFYTAAVGMLRNTDRAQMPSWRAIKKMMVVLATAPKVIPLGLRMPVPYPLMQYRHERGSWRSYPSQQITSNLGSIQ